MFPEVDYQTSSVNLDVGEFLVIYTDGVSEAANVRGELFEEAGLRAILEKFEGQSVEDLANMIRDGVKAFTTGAPQSDDVTILVVQYKGPGA
jgi:sigma-B regulation protein RsbU (phosphoserine phosphatase)